MRDNVGTIIFLVIVDAIILFAVFMPDYADLVQKTLLEFWEKHPKTSGLILAVLGILFTAAVNQVCKKINSKRQSKLDLAKLKANIIREILLTEQAAKNLNTAPKYDVLIQFIPMLHCHVDRKQIALLTELISRAAEYQANYGHRPAIIRIAGKPRIITYAAVVDVIFKWCNAAVEPGVKPLTKIIINRSSKMVINTEHKIPKTYDPA